MASTKGRRTFFSAVQTCTLYVFSSTAVLGSAFSQEFVKKRSAREMKITQDAGRLAFILPSFAGERMEFPAQHVHQSGLSSIIARTQKAEFQNAFFCT